MKNKRGKKTGLVTFTQGSSEEISESVEANPEAWVWCLICEKLSQAKELLEDHEGVRTRCPHDNCNGSGMGFNVCPIEPDGTFFGERKVDSMVGLVSGTRVPLYID